MPSIMDIQNTHFHEDDLASFFGIGKSKEAYKIKIRELERNIRQLKVLLERKDDTIKELKEQNKDRVDKLSKDLKNSQGLFDTMEYNFTQYRLVQSREQQRLKEEIKKLEQGTQGTKQSDWDDIINNKIFSPENVLNLKPGWTWYDVLCVARDSNVEKITEHCKVLQAYWHPDNLQRRRGMDLDPRMTEASLNETTKCLGKARDILTNEAKRRAYDKEIANPSYKPDRWPMPQPAPRQDKAFSNPYFVSARRNDIFERYAKVRSCPGRL